MIQEGHGNLLQADAEALVNTVNTVGYMGRGIALLFKQAFPGNFAAYTHAVKKGEVQPGRIHVFRTGLLTNPRFIFNFPTKRHWRGRSRIEDIDSGLAALAEQIRKLEVRSIAVPPLGCGNGGLDWREVRPRIVAAFEKMPDVLVLLFAPRGAPVADEMPIGTLAPVLPEALARQIRESATKHGVEAVRVFGSRARGDARPESDLDLLIRLTPGHGYDDFFAFCEEVEAAFGRRVDVLTESGLSPYIRRLERGRSALKDNQVYLHHILDSIERILAYTAEGQKAFDADTKTQDAVVRNLSIIGEAVKRISGPMRDANPTVPWKQMAGMHDRVVHDYVGVSLDIVWDVIENHLPSLRPTIRALIKDTA